MSTISPLSVAVPVKLSVEEFAARYNDIPGAELVKEPPMPNFLHGKLCLKIAARILNHVEEHDLGHVMSNDTWVRNGTDTVRGADVLYISYERLPKGIPIPEGVSDLAPELVIEVKSPSNHWTDLFIKVVFAEPGER